MYTVIDFLYQIHVAIASILSHMHSFMALVANDSGRLAKRVHVVVCKSNL